MTLAEHKPATRGKPGLPCHIATVLSQLNDEDRALLQSWLDDRTKHGHGAIARSLTEYGYPTTRFKVSWHRNQECRCFQ